MTKEELMRVMRLPSALEALGMMRDRITPNYLLEPFVHGLGKAILRELQSAQPVAQPLSEVEIGAIWANTLRTTTGPLPTVEFARAIEAAIREVK